MVIQGCSSFQGIKQCPESPSPELGVAVVCPSGGRGGWLHPSGQGMWIPGVGLFLSDPQCYLSAPMQRLNHYIQVGKQKENIPTNLE